MKLEARTMRQLPENEAEALRMIEHRRNENERLRKYLPYADHGAYGQDKNRIASNERDIAHYEWRIENGEYV